MEDITFQFLFHYVNVHMARKIEQAEIRLDYLKYYRKALDELRVRKKRIRVHLGPVPNPDVCVTIAEFFMKIHDIAWVVVSGTYRGKLIIIVRNDGFRKDAGKLVTSAFGHLGTGGGHKAMARAEIPLKNLKDEVQIKDDKSLARWIGRAMDRSS